MCPLLPRKDRRRRHGAALARRIRFLPHLKVLSTCQLHTSASMLSPPPVLPEKGNRADMEGMKQYADLARLLGGTALPLALFAQGTGTTTPDTSRIHHAQAAISFSTLFLDTKFLVGWTPKRPIWLEGEIVAGEATSLPC